MTRKTTTKDRTDRAVGNRESENEEWGWGNELPFIRRDLERSPGDPILHHWLGVCLHELGEFIESLFHLRRAEEIAPGDCINLEWLRKCEKSLERSR